MVCWVVYIVLLLFFVFLFFIEVDYICLIDIVFYENRYIVFFIMVILEVVCIFLIFVFYCLVMFSFKKNYLNVKKINIF